MQSFIEVTARHIRREMAAGRACSARSGETATALVWMMERYLTLTLGREPHRDRGVIVETLETIWSRVLYAEA